MRYALKERIGFPELFVGRKKELAFFLKWIEGIKKEKSKSIALLARRKMGKTALMERLYNLTFEKNDKVIPFYFEIQEEKKWVGDFCQEFFLTFIYQYIAFKSRKPEYVTDEDLSDFEKAIDSAQKENLDYLVPYIQGVAHAFANEKFGILWRMVRETPKKIAAHRDEVIVQLIDEFQFINDKVYQDKAFQIKISDMAAGYLSAAESKVAPLLVSGSLSSWTIYRSTVTFLFRFDRYFMENIPQGNVVEPEQGVSEYISDNFLRRVFQKEIDKFNSDYMRKENILVLEEIPV